MDEVQAAKAGQVAKTRSEYKADRIASQTAAALNSPHVLLHIDVVCAMVGVSRGTLYKRIRAGTFVKPVRFGARCSRWHAQAVTDWLKQQTGVVA